MKADKRFLKIQGEFLVDRAVRVAAAAIQQFGGEVLLCGEVPGRKSLPDATSGQGPLAGLLSALGALMDRKSPLPAWLLCLPVDMPFLSTELLRELAAHGESTGATGELGVNAIVFESFEMPFLVRVSPFMKKAVEDLCATAAPEARSVRSLLRRAGAKTIALEPKFQGMMVNANEPSDWRLIRKEVSRE